MHVFKYSCSLNCAVNLPSTIRFLPTEVQLLWLVYLFIVYTHTYERVNHCSNMIHIYRYVKFISANYYQYVSLPNPSSRTMALGSNQHLAGMSTRNHPGAKKRPAHRADNLAAICEPNV
jgi:hypothetical protein